MQNEKTTSDILDRIGRQSGMTVPEGYFDDVARRIAASLPPAVEEQPVRPRSFWQQVRPYVYMAAMFAGIWCMLQIVPVMSNNQLGGDMSPMLANVMQDETYVSEWCAGEMGEYDLYDDLFNSGMSVDELKK